MTSTAIMKSTVTMTNPASTVMIPTDRTNVSRCLPPHAQPLAVASGMTFEP